MVKKSLSNVERWQQAIADRRIPDLLAYGLAVFSLILGLSMILDEIGYLAAPSFRDVFAVAKPLVWGILFSGSGVLLGIGFFRDRKSGQYAAVVLTALYCALAALLAAPPARDTYGTVWSGSVVYSFAAWISALTVIACTAKVAPRD